MTLAEFDVVTVSAIVGAVFGPGGVFFLLVRKAINGSAEAIHRVETSVAKISKTQDADHDTLTKAVVTLQTMKGENEAYYKTTSENQMAIGRILERCDILHGGKGTVK